MIGFLDYVLGFDACMYYLAIFLLMEVHEMCIRDWEELEKIGERLAKI